MRRILLIGAMLLMATPAFAALSITATADNNVVTISYSRSSSDPCVRAFALEVTIASPAVIQEIWDYNTGESNKPANQGGGGYGIFPGQFRDHINASSPNWIDPNYNPVAPSGDPGASGTGLGTNKIIIELGTLYKGDTNRPGTSGTLCKLGIGCGEGASSGDYALSLVTNSNRGGVVNENGDAMSPTLNGTTVTVNCAVCSDCPLDIAGESGPDGWVGAEDLIYMLTMLNRPGCVANGYYCDCTNLPPMP